MTDYPGADRGPLLGYGCEVCHLWWDRREAGSKAARDATVHAKSQHEDGLDVVVEVRDPDPWSADEGGASA